MSDARTLQMFTPEGKFLCAVCYEAFPLAEAWKDARGVAWDMCRPHGERENEGEVGNE